MAALDFFRPTAPGLSVGGRVSYLLNNTIGAFANWRLTMATRKELGKLSNHELEDIGLSRGDIDAISARSSR